MNDYLDNKAVAEMIGVTRATLYNYRRSNQFPEYTAMKGNKIMWHRDDVEAWIKKHGRVEKRDVIQL